MLMIYCRDRCERKITRSKIDKINKIPVLVMVDEEKIHYKNMTRFDNFKRPWMTIDC